MKRRDTDAHYRFVTTMPADFLLGFRWRDVAFVAGDRSYDWVDVFLAAMWRGEWAQFERELLKGLAYQAVGVDPDGARPGEGDLDDAANAFRYARGLIASDEAIAWLDSSGLTVDAWADFLLRRLLRERWRTRVEQPPRRAVVADLADLDVAAEGICSGVFDRFACVLAGRAALAAASGGAGDSPSETPRLDRVFGDHHEWLAVMERGETERRLLRLAALEQEFARRAVAVVTADALAAQLRDRRHEWMRLDLERLAFTSIDAAREAAYCLRDDRRSLTEIAIDVRQPVHDTRDVLDRLERDLREPVLSADIDALIGPIAVGSRIELVRVVSKRSPDLRDPLVRALATEAVVSHMVSSAMLTHVRWSDPRRAIAATTGAAIA
jgi:hypothetical protein